MNDFKNLGHNEVRKLYELLELWAYQKIMGTCKLVGFKFDENTGEIFLVDTKGKTWEEVNGVLKEC